MIIKFLSFQAVTHLKLLLHAVSFSAHSLPFPVIAPSGLYPNVEVGEADPWKQGVTYALLAKTSLPSPAKGFIWGSWSGCLSGVFEHLLKPDIQITK